MKNVTTRLLLPLTVLTATSYGHTVAYPHGHPHVTTLAWSDLLITGGVIGMMVLGAVALLRSRDRQKPVRQKLR